MYIQNLVTAPRLIQECKWLGKEVDIAEKEKS